MDIKIIIEVKHLPKALVVGVDIEINEVTICNGRTSREHMIENKTIIDLH